MCRFCKTLLHSLLTTRRPKGLLARISGSFDSEWRLEIIKQQQSRAPFHLTPLTRALIRKPLHGLSCSSFSCEETSITSDLLITSREGDQRERLGDDLAGKRARKGEREAMMPLNSFRLSGISAAAAAVVAAAKSKAREEERPSCLQHDVLTAITPHTLLSCHGERM